MKASIHGLLAKAVLLLGWCTVCSAILCSPAMAQGLRGYSAELYNWAMVPPVESGASYSLAAVSNKEDLDVPCSDKGDTITFTKLRVPFEELLWVKLYRGAPGEIGVPYGVLYERGKTEWVETLEIPAGDCADWTTEFNIYAVVATRDHPEGAARGPFRASGNNPVEEESWGYIKSRYREAATR